MRRRRRGRVARSSTQMIYQFNRRSAPPGARSRGPRGRAFASRPAGMEPLEGRVFMHAGHFEVKVNFQPAAAPVPAGYLVDAGAAFGDRGNGQRYGWDADNAANARDRNSAASPDQRFDTLNHMQNGGANRAWELEVPEGMYSVRVVAGDPQYPDSTVAINAEGTLAVGGTLNTSTRWRDGTATVHVT